MQEGKYQMENGALIPTNFILLTNETESYFLLLFLASQSHLHFSASYTHLNVHTDPWWH